MTSRIESSPILAIVPSEEPTPVTTVQVEEMLRAVTAEQISSIARKLALDVSKTLGHDLTIQEIMVGFCVPPSGGIDLLRLAWKDHPFESYASTRKSIPSCSAADMYYLINDDLSKTFSIRWGFFNPGFWFSLSDINAYGENATKNKKFSTPYPVKYQHRLKINYELTQRQKLAFTMEEEIDGIEIRREDFFLHEIERPADLQ